MEDADDLSKHKPVAEDDNTSLQQSRAVVMTHSHPQTYSSSKVSVKWNERPQQMYTAT